MRSTIREAERQPTSGSDMKKAGRKTGFLLMRVNRDQKLWRTPAAIDVLSPMLT
jgi:hypothetical protein